MYVKWINTKVAILSNNKDENTYRFAASGKLIERERERERRRKRLREREREEGRDSEREKEGKRERDLINNK